LLVALTLAAAVQPCVAAGFPRVANIYFPSLANCSDEELLRLSRHDVVVLGARNEVQAPDELATLKSLNPDNLLLAHMCFSYHGHWTSPPIFAELGDALYENNWWLRDTSGEIYLLPNGNGLINLTVNCPTNAEGQRFCDWYGDFLAGWLGPGGPWDGIFLDCVWDNVSWSMRQTGIPADSDLDGLPDDFAELDAAWREGSATITSRLRELVGEDYVLMANGGNTLWDDLDGTTFECFPEQPNGWYRNITDPAVGYIAADANFRDPPVNIVNTTWYGPAGEDGPVWSGLFMRRFLFTLASTLVFGDGYYSTCGPDFSETWWFLYFDLDLGEPLGSAEDAVATPGDGPEIELGDMIKLRRFSNGVAVVNPTNVMQEIELPGAYYDPERWNGDFFPVSSIATSVAVSSRMGRVLVGSGVALPAAMGLVSAAFDGSGIELSWQGPAWASRYAVYRTAVRGDGSTTVRTFVSVVEGATFYDVDVQPGRRYIYSVSPIDAECCEGWSSDSDVVSTELSCGQWVALMVDDPGGMLLLTWSVPDVPGEMIFELERRDDGGGREWLGRFTAGAGEAISFTDRTATPGETYRYELFEVLDAGRRLVGSVRALVPDGGGGSTGLLACRPQPVSHWPATISFRLGDDDNWEGEPRVRLTVYDVRGRVIRRLVDGPLPRGDHSVEWDGLDASGLPVPSGCYLYDVDIGGERLRGKAVVVR
jgi:hypothetical protein